MVDLDGFRLRQLGEEGLVALLTLRPDAAEPAPRTLSQLAGRLRDPLSIVAALRRLDLPTLQVAEAIAALGGRIRRSRLDRLLGVTDPAPVDRALAALSAGALVLTEPDDDVVLVPAARFAWSSPLRLGPPLAMLVEPMTMDDLRFLCGRLGVPTPNVKSQAKAALLTALADTDLVLSIVDKAPDEFRDLLGRVAAGGVRVTEYAYYGIRDADARSPVRWAVSRGLLMRSLDWANEFEMPAEVALALRGPDYTAPFDPLPPHCPQRMVDEDVVARDATAAAIAFLQLATGVLEEASRSRVPALRTGGVGVRELRRLAKAHNATSDQVRLLLSTAHGAGLITTRLDGLTPTAQYDSWLDAEPGVRLAQLVRAWWSLAAVPTMTAAPRTPAKGDGPPADRPWLPSDVDPGAIALRAAATRLVEAGAPADWSAFTELVCWHYPHIRRGDRDSLVRAVEAWHGEAATLGVLGAGQLSPAGRALLAEPPDAPALAAAFAAVGSVVRTAHLQADLTAVVTGPPSAALSTVLDAAADRESAAAASIWRFSPASVRRALDAGHAPDALLDDLVAIAAGPVPQTLEYLIRDVARRHGAIRASAAACCLRSDDTALLAEVSADRRLRTLGLRLLAPTVVVSHKPLPDTLAALRKAGYAPVEEDANGDPVIEATLVRRAETHGLQPWKGRASAPDPVTTPAGNLETLVARLLAGPDDEPTELVDRRPDPELLRQHQLDAPVDPPARPANSRTTWQRRW